MDIAAEKEEIIKRFKQIYDADLIQAIKSLLDFGVSKQDNNKSTLDTSIEKGIKRSVAGEVTLHDQVMADARKRYQA